MKARFALGRVVATPAALTLLKDAQVEPVTLLGRHVTGDWGELDPEDARANEAALADEARVLSSYPVKGDEKVWVITEADRSVTTILTPHDY